MPTAATTAEAEKAVVRHTLREPIFVSSDRIY